MDWVKSAEISHFEAGSDYSLYPNFKTSEINDVERDFGLT